MSVFFPRYFRSRSGRERDAAVAVPHSAKGTVSGMRIAIEAE
jgi:hypothetical protein